MMDFGKFGRALEEMSASAKTLEEIRDALVPLAHITVWRDCPADQNNLTALKQEPCNLCRAPRDWHRLAR